jgi:hypothetical protein
MRLERCPACEAGGRHRGALPRLRGRRSEPWSVASLARPTVGTVERCLACEADTLGTVERCLACEADTVGTVERTLGMFQLHTIW